MLVNLYCFGSLGKNDPELQYDVKHPFPVCVTLLSNLLAFCLGESSNNIFWNFFTFIDSAYTFNTQMSSYAISRRYPELLVAIVALDLKSASFFVNNSHVFPFLSMFLGHDQQQKITFLL